LHAFLRFSTGVTLAFILCEAMGWAPTFLTPVLLAVFLTSLPFSPPFNVGASLVVVMAAAAGLAFLLSSLLRESPGVLVGAIGVIIFLALAALAQARAKLPATLLLVCMATIPVIAMAAPAYAGLLPTALVRGTALAMLILWSMHALWPEVMPPAAAPMPAPLHSPMARALVGTAIIMPVMLVFLMFGLTDALPVMVTVVLLVTNFDPGQGAMQAAGMVFGNLLGGFIGFVAFLLLSIAPSLVTLALISFLIASIFALRIGKGGAGAAVAVLTCNSCFIILGIAISSPDSSAGVWMTRVLQFVLASLFATGMMTLAWRKP
jgi:Protein of unknown function (DUF2955)